MLTMTARSLRSMIWNEKGATVTAVVRDVEVAVEFFAVRWPVERPELPLRLALPLSKAAQETLWESRKRASAAGDIGQQFVMAAHALHVAFERSARQGLGFARVSAATHLRGGERTDTQFLSFMNASPDQLEQRGRERLIMNAPSLDDLLIDMHFPHTPYAAEHQATAARFIATHASEIAGAVHEVDRLDDVHEYSDLTGELLADKRVKQLRDRLKRFLRAAQRAGIPESALLREAILIEIEAEQADGREIRGQLANHFLPLEAKVFDLMFVGKPRPPGASTIVVPLGLSVLARSLFEICGGWLEKVPADMLILPDLLSVLDCANVRAPSFRRSVQIGVGLAVMASTWREHDRDVARESKRRRRRQV